VKCSFRCYDLHERTLYFTFPPSREDLAHLIPILLVEQSARAHTRDAEIYLKTVTDSALAQVLPFPCYVL